MERAIAAQHLVKQFNEALEVIVRFLCKNRIVKIIVGGRCGDSGPGYLFLWRRYGLNRLCSLASLYPP
jgi:hypothetical protein